MGKPRMILLVRHAQSEGNKNRDIHQYVPDHRVRLTPEGQLQAEEAGRRLRQMLKPDDTIQFFTSPYRRTRETTEGILRTLTSNEDGLGPSPYPRDKITIYEEPRLREQDFGNFQPCSAEMERMWQERADYGHFFYRIPNGESAADAYDRCSGFNESLWRQFGDKDFPSVCVLVTHGLMTRIFLMKWYHWSVEYFEDLRNINHCEFITMKQDPDNGRYILQNQLRTWSELKRKTSSTSSTNVGVPAKPIMWGGCAAGCDHANMNYARRPRRQNTLDFAAAKEPTSPSNDRDDHHAIPLETRRTASRSKSDSGLRTNPEKSFVAPSKAEGDETYLTPESSSILEGDGEGEEESEGEDVGRGISGDEGDDADADSASPVWSPKKSSSTLSLPARQRHRPDVPLRMGRNASSSALGLGNANDISDEADDSDWFDTNVHQIAKRMSVSQGSRSDLTRSALSQINESAALSSSPPKNANLKLGRSGSFGRSENMKRSGSAPRLARRGTKSEKEMIEESGMAMGKRADALGDVDDEDDVVEDAKLEDRKGFGEIY